MLKKIWQSLVRWLRKSFGLKVASKRDLAAVAALPPLDDIDREYLFMQLLEGVAHGWQQPRVIEFFNKIRHRIRKSDWLEWLDRFGDNLLNSPAPNYELARRMVQLGQLDCGEVGDLAAEYGSRLLDRQHEELPMGMLPIVEFDTPTGLFDEDEDTDLFDMNARMDTGYRDSPIERQTRAYGEVPPDLVIGAVPKSQFTAMLEKDPDLVAEVAAQLGIETTDPQVIVNAVMAQMQNPIEPPTTEPIAATSPPLTKKDRALPSPPPPPPKPFDRGL
jgi:hypothetical protein